MLTENEYFNLTMPDNERPISGFYRGWCSQYGNDLSWQGTYDQYTPLDVCPWCHGDHTCDVGRVVPLLNPEEIEHDLDENGHRPDEVNVYPGVPGDFRPVVYIYLDELPPGRSWADIIRNRQMRHIAMRQHTTEVHFFARTRESMSWQLSDTRNVMTQSITNWLRFTDPSFAGVITFRTRDGRINRRY
jgi:hypothetical protein